MLFNWMTYILLIDWMRILHLVVYVKLWQIL